MNFDELNLAPAILKAVREQGYDSPTPIQAQAIPAVLAGQDLLAGAQTGTGKTAAFTLPMLHKLSMSRSANNRFGVFGVRALVLTPTRELAAQVEESVRTYGKYTPVKSTVIFGGVGMQPQIERLAQTLDVLVATPGRLLDHVGQRTLDLSTVEALVLDEADRMLDMGFIQPIRRIVKAMPAKRQTLLFSATMPREIAGLAADLLNDPIRVEVTPVATTVERIDQRCILVSNAAKRDVLVDLLGDAAMSRALVFTRTKHGADRVAKQLESSGIGADAIHGNKSQGQRERALLAFREGRSRVLVATDIAARGIDVDGVSHVVNFDLPNEPESYVHRIGRTARAGADGIAISLVGEDERGYLKDIEKLIGRQVPLTRHESDPGAASGPPPHVRQGRSAGRPQQQQHRQDRPQEGRAGQRPRRGNAGGGKPVRNDAGGGQPARGLEQMAFLKPTGERPRRPRRSAG